MTMCVKRAGLVWALVLLTTTYFILSCAAPTSANNEGADKYKGTPGQNSARSKRSGDGNPTKDDTTTEPPAVSTTPVLDEVQDTSDTPAVSNDPNDRTPSDAEKDMTEKYLYFQITKFISQRNLTLSDIRNILSDKDDGQFMFALADKLGFLSDGRHDDPHIPVIMSHKDKLIELLEKMATTKESKSHSQQEHNEGPTVSSNETPTNKEPASPSDSKKIGFEVSADISGLGSDAIQEILSDFSFSNSFGYAVGVRLGYSPKDEHMKYLENADADELKKLKEFLQRTLESKTTSKTTPDDSIDNSQNKPPPSGGGQEDVDDNGGQRPGEGRDSMSEEDSEPSYLHNDGDTQDSEKQTLTLTAKPPKEHVVQATKVPTVNTKSKPDGTDNTNGKESVPTDTSGLGDSDQKNENPGADQAPGAEAEDKKGDVRTAGEEKDDDHNEGRPLLFNDLHVHDEEETDQSDGTNYDDSGLEFLSRIDKEKRTSLLNSKDFQNYLAKTFSELYEQFMNDDSKADPDEIDLALDEYLRWLSERNGVMEDEKGGGSKDSKFEVDKPKAKEDSPDQPLDSDNQAKGAFDSLGDKEEEVEYDHPRSSSSFGALHFLSIFLVLGAVVVIGYFCMHNRKKIREGVATYIKDSSKRRRRAREYKPLIST